MANDGVLSFHFFIYRLIMIRVPLTQLQMPLLDSDSISPIDISLSASFKSHCNEISFSFSVLTNKSSCWRYNLLGILLDQQKKNNLKIKLFHAKAVKLYWKLNYKVEKMICWLYFEAGFVN